MNAFSLLNAEIQNVLEKTEKFSARAPTEPQELGIPLILEGKDVLLIAPTGSGKTEAAVLPVFQKILEAKEKERNSEKKGFYALYITPLRALNRDMLSRLEQWGAQLGITIEVRHGDTSTYARRRQALNPPDMLITTPETIQAMIPGKRLRESLKSLRYVIIDEVHELANSKRGAQLAVALERMAELAGDFQRICLSATVGNPEEVAKFFAGCGREKMQVVNTDTDSTKAIEIEVLNPQKTKRDEKKAKELGVDPEVIAHVRTIRTAVKKCKSSLIFVNTRRAAEMLASVINKFESGLIGVHHGSLSKEIRIEAEDKFKQGAIKGLICTSSMELGIDIGSIELVIQYTSPREVARLVQRVGRASHFVKKISTGKVIALTPDDIAESLVIARRARDGEIEDIKLKEGSLDVLANQICGMLLDVGAVSTDKLYSRIQRAYPFRNVSFDSMMRVIEQLEEERLVRIDGGDIRRSKSTRTYYYENLSMIPDERKYEVYDMVSGKLICLLDERFMLNFAAPGALFVAKGETWRIVDSDVETEKEKINVEPGVKREGEIPKWEGEEIPVPFAVAQEVGELRNKIASFFASDSSSAVGKIADLETDLKREYGVRVNSSCLETLIDLIKEQIKEKCPVPTAKEVVVETTKDEKEMVINACFGHRVNETFGRLIVALLGARLGTDISMEVDPYRIKLKSGRRMKKEALQQTLNSIEPEFVQPILEKTLKNSFLLKWELLNVAKRFGALRKDFDRKRISADTLVKLFSGTPIYEETVNDIFADKLDVERTKEVLRGLKSGEIKLCFSSCGLGLSPIGASGYLSWRDVLASERNESVIIDALRNRIMNDRVILFCVNCKRWESQKRVKTVIESGTESLVCPFCNSRLIAALKPWEKEEIKIVRRTGSAVEKENKARVKRVYRNANLVLSHGVLAVIALAARGIGPEVASRIIRRSKDIAGEYEYEYDFYRNILEEERRYMRTKRFWEL
ncbi:MAG: DEAD/DEAH box helicase [Methanophagales archaeon]|nr:DEAD/DEAH box helicase [Methanophagales archaeon]